MVRKINKIVDGLFLGNVFAACEAEILDRHKISAILTVMEEARPLFRDRCYLCIDAIDDEAQSLIDYFETTNKFIHSARLRGQNVLVHCYMGASRSVTIVAAYLMTANNLNFQQALRFLQIRRPIANPNVNFKIQLKQFEEEMIETLRDRLARDFKCKDCSLIYKVLKHGNNEKDSDKEAYPQMQLSNFDVSIGEVTQMVQNPTPATFKGTKLMENVYIYEPYDLELFCEKFTMKKRSKSQGENKEKQEKSPENSQNSKEVEQ